MCIGRSFFSQFVGQNHVTPRVNSCKLQKNVNLRKHCRQLFLRLRKLRMIHSSRSPPNLGIPHQERMQRPSFIYHFFSMSLMMHVIVLLLNMANTKSFGNEVDINMMDISYTVGCTEIWPNQTKVCSRWRLHVETLLKIRNK